MKPIWPLLFACAPPILGLYVAYRSWPWWTPSAFDHGFDKWFPLFLGSCLVLIASAFLGGLVGPELSEWIGRHSDQVWHEYGRDVMVSMRSADGPHGGIAGGIFMVSGSLGTGETYFWYAKKDTGGFRPRQWRPDYWTTVYEEDRQDGEVIKFDCGFSHPWVYWFGEPSSNLRMDFHIPTGSIDRRFSLK